MLNKSYFKKIIFLLVSSFCFQLGHVKIQAQGRRAEITEMKDSVNLYISTIKTLGKTSSTEKNKIDDTRTRLMVLLIYNNNKKCGEWPHPLAKMEEFEVYWKCVLIMPNRERNLF